MRREYPARACAAVRLTNYVQRAGVALTPAGDALTRLPERSGTLVYGSLAAIDLDKWLPLFTAIRWM